MRKYRNTSPTAVNGPDNRNSACGPVYCGSFALLLNLSDRGRPVISIVMLPIQEDRFNLAKAPEFDVLASIPISANHGGTLNAQEQASSQASWPGINIQENRARDEQPVPRLFGKQSAANQPNVSPSDLGLTGRQCDVLALMMEGKSNKAICRILDLAEPTVKNHVTAILKILEVTNRTEAVIAASKLGWEFSGARGAEGSTTRNRSNASYRGCHARAA